MAKRIVIKVDQPGAGASPRTSAPVARRRRWPRVLAILAVLVFVIGAMVAAGGFLGWRYYQSTPTYTLALMIDAAQRNDLAELQKRIDEEEIVKNMISNVSQKAAGRYGFALNSSIQERIDTLIPTLLPRMKQSVNDEVVKEIKAFASQSDPKSFIFLLVSVPSLVTVTTEGETARARATISGRMIELTMRRDADRWKVTEYKDEVLVQRITDGVMKELPAIGSVDSSSPLLKKRVRGKRRP